MNPLAYPKDVLGPFELHVVVHLDDEPQLQRWLLEFHKTKSSVVSNPKLTGFCAFYGDHPLHLMLSCFLVGCSAEEAFSETKSIVANIERNNIRVLRKKIESNLHADGVPATLNSSHEYYEIHIKVKLDDQAGLYRWEHLSGISRPYGGHLFLNNRSKSQGTHAIVTVRTYKTSLEEFEDNATRLRRDIEKDGFNVVSVRSEYSYYDTNPMLDKGWLF